MPHPAATALAARAATARAARVATATARVATATALAALLALALASCSPQQERPVKEPPPPPGTATPSPPAVTAPPTGGDPATPQARLTEPTVLYTGLEVPWGIAWLDGTAYVTERDSGRVLRLGHDGATEEVHRFEVDAISEAGLLGLAAHDGYLYAYYTTQQDNRVVRFRPGERPEPILTGIAQASVHDGGRIAFGPDGMLYVGTGDARNPDLAQDPGSLNGKILRLTPDGDVPDGNPFPGSPVYSLGHRNVQGLAWTDDGTLYASEFGPDRDDEINRIQPGGNYGWPRVTGDADSPEFVDPVAVRQPSEASWSGLAYLDGALYAASLRGQTLWRFEVTADGLGEGEELHAGEWGRLRAAVAAPDGTLWITTSNRDNRGNPTADDDRIIAIPPR